MAFVPTERRVNGEGWWGPRHIRHQQTDAKQTDLAFFPHQVRLEDPSTAHTPEPDAEGNYVAVFRSSTYSCLTQVECHLLSFQWTQAIRLDWGTLGVHS